jgi:nucleoside-diphosphate-sugar epimerase
MAGWRPLHMRVFLTGGTGYVGSAIRDALVRAGHEVTAVVRTPEKARLVTAEGARAIVADLAAPATYRTAADAHDVLVHAAETKPAERQAVDRIAIDTLLAAAHEGRRPRLFVYTSGVWVLGNTPRPAGEDAPVDPVPHVAWRPGHERLVLDSAANGLRTIVVRPGIVFGGQGGIVGDLLKDASNGLIRVIGDGTNRWPLVYDRDLGDLYVRLIASADASGIYHANDEGDERVNDIVEDIAEHMPVRPDVRHMPIKEARLKLGPKADALALDQVVRSARARALGWAPTLRSVSGNVPRLMEEWGAGRR